MSDTAAKMPIQMPFDYKDILNIHGYFLAKDVKSDAARDILAECETKILATLKETPNHTISSGNYQRQSTNN